MNALLILLGLLSVTWVVSNLSILKRSQAFSYVSITLLAGMVFSSEGLMPLLPSTRESLSWALRVGLTWVTFLAGTRLSEITPSRDGVKKLLPIFGVYLIYFAIGTVLTVYWHIGGSFPVRMAMTLFLTAALFSSRENPFLLSVLFLSLFFLFAPGSEKSFGFMDLVYPIALGPFMGVVCRLIIAPGRQLDTPTRLTLVGLCVLGTGWSMGVGALEVLFGLSLGWAMAWVHKYGVCKDPKLKASEGPIRFVIALFAGIYMQITPMALIVGTSLVLLRVVLKWMMLKIGLREASNEEVLNQVLPISPLALPIILSLHLSPVGGSETLFLLSAFSIGFIVNDFVGLFVELSSKKALKKESLA